MNYSEAMEIRLRAAQRQPVDPGRLELAKTVVAEHRAQRISSSDHSGVGAIDENGKISMVWVRQFLTSIHPTRCEWRCNHLGVCQAYKDCKTK